MQTQVGKGEKQKNSPQPRQKPSVELKKVKPNEKIDLPDVKLNKHSLSKDQIDKNVALAKAYNGQTFNAKVFENFTQQCVSIGEVQTTQQFKAYQSGSFELIDTLDKLKRAAAFLSKQSVIAVDLENYNENSYEGFTCLVQISANFAQSTPIKTYIIDVLQAEVHDNFKAILGTSIFENDAIIKILHGAQSTDVVWLQRDFGVQLTSMYDTQEFQRSFLSEKKIALYNLLEQYCPGMYLYTGDQKKEFQQCDWSERPLTIEQLDYAGQDTYYLHQIAVLQQLKCFTEPMKQKNRGKQTSNPKQTTDQETIKQEFQVQFDKLQTKVHEATYRSARDSYNSESYRKSFKKNMDMYDPSNDQFLTSELVFRDLFDLREQIAWRIDQKCLALSSDNDLCLISRQRPMTWQQFENLRKSQNLDSPLFAEKRLSQLLVQSIQLTMNSAEKLANDKVELKKYYDQLQYSKNSNCHINQKKLERKAQTAELYKNHCTYDSCRVLNNSGKFMFTCDDRKAKSYVRDGHVDLIQSEPYMILKFKQEITQNEHESTLTTTQRQMLKRIRTELYSHTFYETARDNVCAVCQTTKELGKFQTVPNMYRPQLPHHVKVHTSNDVLLMCQPCHKSASIKQQLMIEKIAVSMGFPLEEQDERQTFNDALQEYNNLRRLILQGSLPEARKKTIQDKLDELMKNKQQLFKEQLKNTENYKPEMDPKTEEELYQLLDNVKPIYLKIKSRISQHGKHVIDKFLAEDKIVEFIKMWRQHFKDSNKPKEKLEMWDDYTNEIYKVVGL